MANDLTQYIDGMHRALIDVKHSGPRPGDADFTMRQEAYQKLDNTQKAVLAAYIAELDGIKGQQAGKVRSIAEFAGSQNITQPDIVDNMRKSLMAARADTVEGAVFPGGAAVTHETVAHERTRTAGPVRRNARGDVITRPGDEDDTAPGRRKTAAAGYVDEFGPWGGALIGAIAGFAMGGPVGAFVGLIIGLALANAFTPKIANLIDKKFGPKPPPPPTTSVDVRAQAQTPALVIEGTQLSTLKLPPGDFNVSHDASLIITASGMPAKLTYHQEDAGSAGSRLVIDKMVLKDGTEVTALAGVTLPIDGEGKVNLASTNLLSHTLVASEAVIKAKGIALNANFVEGLTPAEKAAPMKDATAPQDMEFTYQYANGNKTTSVKLKGQLMADGLDSAGQPKYKFVVNDSGNAIPTVKDAGDKALSTQASLVTTGADGRKVPLEITGLTAPKADSTQTPPVVQTLEQYMTEPSNAAQITAVLKPKLKQPEPAATRPGAAPYTPSSPPLPSRSPSVP